MTVRTARLVDATATTTVTTVYTCPAATTTIIKRIAIGNPTGGALSTVTAFVRSSGGTNRAIFRFSLAVGDTYDLESWTVLEPGDEFRIQATPSSAVNFWVSGTQLAGVAP